MRYKLLGRSGLRVSELCYGAMTFGQEWGWGSNKKESRKVFDAFAKAGGNFIDTANYYTNGTSEKLLAEFLRGQRERFVLATKYSLTMRSDDPNGGGNHRKNLVQSLEASLKRLKTDYVDLYWVHAWDFLTPVQEVMRALDDMVRAGKILYVGISDAPAWIVSQANTMACLRGWTPFIGLQIQYGLIERTPERELLPMAEALGIAVTPWGVLGGGLLTGKYGDEKVKRMPKDARYADGPWGKLVLQDRNYRIAGTVRRVAEKVGRTPSQVALNWVLRQRRGTIIPIIGAKKLSQLKDNLGCLDFELGKSDLKALDEASRVELGFPHDFLSSDIAKEVLFGKTWGQLDVRR